MDQVARVELTGWSVLPRALRRQYLTIVGNYGGEWWGQGRAHFTDGSAAQCCVRDVSSRLGLRAFLLSVLPAAETRAQSA
jgi:hypothetical protein